MDDEVKEILGEWAERNAPWWSATRFDVVDSLLSCCYSNGNPVFGVMAKDQPEVFDNGAAVPQGWRKVETWPSFVQPCEECGFRGGHWWWCSHYFGNPDRQESKHR